LDIRRSVDKKLLVQLSKDVASVQGIEIRAEPNYGMRQKCSTPASGAREGRRVLPIPKVVTIHPELEVTELPLGVELNMRLDLNGESVT
jgi:hypothetical protein